MELIANKPLYLGRGRTVAEGESFEATRLEARDLLRRGHARQYEVKVIVPTVPPEVQAVVADPFCDVPDLDEESPALVALRAAVRAASVVLEPGDAGSVERRKRGRPRGSGKAHTPTGQPDNRGAA